MIRRSIIPAFAVLATGCAAGPAGVPIPAPYSPAECASCAAWNVPREPFRIFGDSYWVGTDGLGSILITSPEGHVLIDGGLPESAPIIAANIRWLGYDLADVRLILNSHAHFDHAGGIAALQAASGAEVAASAWSAPVLESGVSPPGDPQYGTLLGFPGARDVRVISDSETLSVGPIEVTAHLTPGHTPGGTTWSWRSCEGRRCLDVVYADSQTPVSADGFLYTDNVTYPDALADFDRGLALLEAMPCDIVITPHPGATGVFERIAAREAGDESALIDASGCRRYAEAGRAQVQRRIEEEGG